MQHWDDELGDLVQRVSGRERDRAVEMWRDALDASFVGTPVWVHGDTAIANKALIMVTSTSPGQAEFARYVLDELFAEA